MGTSPLGQPAEKDPYASFRSIASLQRTLSTLPLVDFSRASRLDLFEQPARSCFLQQTTPYFNKRSGYS
jgi:hypothetical protein